MEEERLYVENLARIESELPFAIDLETVKMKRDPKVKMC
jgi:hypothetical protein